MLKTFNGYFLIAFALLLFTGCEPEDEDFNDFRTPTFLVFADKLTVEAGKSIAFRDESVGATSWDWTFDGGTPASSGEQMPTITYNDEGTYLANLITTFNDGSTQRRRLELNIQPRILPDFSIESRQNITETPIPFTNLTAGVGAIPDVLGENDTLVFYEWTFEGGTPATSTASNPVVTYSSTGTFDVTLKVTRPATESEETTIKEGFIEIVDVPILEARTIKFNRDDSKILVIGNEPFATPTAATAAGFTLTAADGSTVAIDAAEIAPYNSNTLVLSFDRSQLTAGEYTLGLTGSDVVFASASLLGAFTKTLQFAGDITWASIIYDNNGNLTDRVVDIGNGKTLLWTTTGSPFSFGTNPALNIFSPTATGFQSIGFRNQGSGVDYTVSATAGADTNLETDVRAVGLEYYRVGPPGTTWHFNHPVTDFIGHMDGMAVTISTDGLTVTVDQNDPGREENSRMTVILENPADVADLILSHTAPQNQNVYVTAAGF